MKISKNMLQVNTSFRTESYPWFNAHSIVLNRVLSITPIMNATAGVFVLESSTSGPSIGPGSDKSKNDTRRNFVLQEASDLDSSIRKENGILIAEPLAKLPLPE